MTPYLRRIKKTWIRKISAANRAYDSISNIVLAQQDDDWQDDSSIDSGDAMYEDDYYVPKNNISVKKVALKNFVKI